MERGIFSGQSENGFPQDAASGQRILTENEKAVEDIFQQPEQGRFFPDLKNPMQAEMQSSCMGQINETGYLIKSFFPCS